MTMTLDEIKAELAAIGSVYAGGRNGWRHQHEARGKQLVAALSRANEAISAAAPKRPAAHGPRGEKGTVICVNCGKRGQDVGCVCDACGAAV